MPQNSVNPKDVEEYMTGLGFERIEVPVSRSHVYRDNEGLMFSARQAAFLYQQTLLARRDELQNLGKDKIQLHECTTENGYGTGVYAIDFDERDDRLAELNQLLQESHNREEEK